MQNDSKIKTSFNVLKKDILKNQYGDFADKIMNFCDEQDFSKIDNIKKFIRENNNIFSNNKNGEMLFGVLKFFSDVAVFNHKDLKIGDFCELLNEHENMLSHEQICHLLINFFDISWNAYTENKNIDNAKNIIKVLLIRLTQLNEKQAYEYDFSSVKRCFEKIMNDVPEIKTHEYLSYISNKLSKTYLPPQFCFEIVLLFGDGIPLKADIKNLGWHAQFARFRLEIEKTLKQYHPEAPINTKHKNNFNADIRAFFGIMDSVYYSGWPAANDAGKAISNKLIEYMKDENVSLKTKLRTMVYMNFDIYYNCMSSSDKEYVLRKDLEACKELLLNNFQSPGDLLTAYAEIFPDLKYNFQEYTVSYHNPVSEYYLNLPYILRFLYAPDCLYNYIKSVEDENDLWKLRFLWQTMSNRFYWRLEDVPRPNITELFQTLDECLDYFLRIYPEINESNVSSLEHISRHINFNDVFPYPVVKIKDFIDNTNDYKKLVLLFYMIFYRRARNLETSESPFDLLDIYTKLYPKIKNYLQKKDTDKLVGECLENIFNAEQLAAALKKTNDPIKFRLLLNALSSLLYNNKAKEQILKIFKSPLDLLEIHMKLYPNIKDNLDTTDKLIYESLANIFNAEQLAAALKETNDLKEFRLLLNALSSLLYKDGAKEQILKIFKSPSDLLEIYTKLCSKIEGNLDTTDRLVCRCLENIFNTEQLAVALKKTNDLKEFRLLLNVLNLFWHEDIEEIFDDPKDLFYICVEKYKSQGIILK